MKGAQYEQQHHRRHIQQTQQPLEDGGTQTIWTCEERQHRVPGSYTAEDVAGIEVRYVANGEKYIDRKISEAIASAAETKLAAYDTLSGAIHEGVNEA